MIPLLIIVAGPNGSGKSTYVENEGLLDKVELVNADVIGKEMYGRSNLSKDEMLSAQKEANIRIERYMEEKRDFCFETVFSHESKIDLIKKAKEKGYVVSLRVINPGDSRINLARVQSRKESGGHDVPKEKTKTRIPKTLSNLRKALPLVDHYVIISSKNENSFEVLIKKNIGGKIEVLSSVIPEWAGVMVRETIEIHNKSSKNNQISISSCNCRSSRCPGIPKCRCATCRG